MQRNKLFALLFISILLIGTISAFEFDNIKSDLSFTKNTKLNIGDKQIDYNPIWEKYKPIEIKNSFGLGKILFSGAIDEHTESCGDNCFSTIDIELGEDGSLIDDIKFYTIKDDGSKIEQDIRSYQFYIKTGENNKEVNDYENNCIYGKALSNGTIPRICSKNIIGSHTETEDIWEEYKLGDSLTSGDYKLKLEGEKKPSRTVDWIIETQGKTIDEWAAWIGNTKIEYFEDKDNSQGSNTNTEWLQQSFTIGTLTANNTYPLGGVCLMLSNTITGDDVITVRIYNATDGEADISKELLSENSSVSLPSITYPTSECTNITMPSFDMNPNEQYGIVMFKNSGSDSVFWEQERVGSIYPGGNWGKSTNSGSTWTDTTYDGWFQVWSGILEGVTAIFSSPENYFNSTDTTIDLSCNFTCIGNVNISVVGIKVYDDENATIYEDGDETPDGLTQSYNKTWTTTALEDGKYTWQCAVFGNDDDESEYFTDNRTFTIDTTNPSINIISPTGTIESIVIGENLSLNWTVTDTNLDSCWFDYNSVNTSVVCADNNYSFITIQDKQSLTFYSNDTVGNLGSNTTSWTYKVLEGLFTYNNETRAGDQEDFSLSLEIAAGYDLTSAIFHYNGYTESPSIFSDGTSRVLNVTNYQIPTFSNDTNVTIYFDLVLDDSTEISTKNYTQLVQAIYLDNCSSYTNILFNISLLDEITQESLNGDIEFYYDLLNVPNYDTISSSTLKVSNVSNFQVCSDINLTNQDFVQSIEIRYVSNGYAPELYHIQRSEITPETTNIYLYDLNESKSTEFKLTYQDDTFNFIEGAVIQLQRRYISEDLYKVVEAPLTSNEGIAVVHVDLDSIKYRAVVIKNGEILDTFDNIVFKCQSILTGECEQKLLGEIDSQNSIDYDTERDFTYSVTPGDNNITISYSIPSSTPSSVNIVLTQKDQWGTTTSCNKTIVSSGGSIQCDYDDTLDISYLDLNINKNNVPISYNTYVVDSETGSDFLDNNYIIVVILMLSLIGMAITSPEWIIVNSILVLLLSGMLWLINGVDFVAGMGILMWLIIAASILIFKLSKQEDR